MSKKKNINSPEDLSKNVYSESISESLNVKQEKINKLKELMPEIFTESDKIDTDKLKKTFRILLVTYKIKLNLHELQY